MDRRVPFLAFAHPLSGKDWGWCNLFESRSSSSCTGDVVLGAILERTEVCSSTAWTLFQGPVHENGFQVGMRLEGIDPRHPSVFCVLTVAQNGPMAKGFQVGMKLEAMDRKNPSLVCVVTIADVVEDHLLVHFDNWDESYDYCISRITDKSQLKTVVLHVHEEGPVFFFELRGRA
ncbi:Lethal(3)malignant brain tumor-like protein 4 [Manis javanica]|nr:Lethal(3)malignant brain tumor-like protein 4 [Manis javanica]